MTDEQHIQVDTAGAQLPAGTTVRHTADGRYTATCDCGRTRTAPRKQAAITWLRDHHCQPWAHQNRNQP